MFYFDNIYGKRILKSGLIQGVQAFFTTRDICICDKSLPPDGNASIPEIIKEITDNKKLICKYLKIEENRLVSPIQTHSDNIEVAEIGKSEYPNTDALILTEQNLGIFLNFADCTPVILYDEKQNIGAIAHAGWRGTVQKIAVKTVQKMCNEYNSTPENILAVIGPAIGFCCYNVGEEVLTQLSQTVSDFEGLSMQENDQIFVDLKNINKQQLLEIGVKKIDVCPYCSVCANDYFFSYRKENGTTKRHSAVLCLK